MALLELFNFVHFLGLAFGLGGATLAAIISIKSKKDKDIAKVLDRIMPPIIKMIWTGMLFLVISGIAITFLVKWPINKFLLIIKHILVFWMIIFGIILGIATKKKKEKTARIFSVINLLLWYLVTLLSIFV